MRRSRRVAAWIRPAAPALPAPVARFLADGGVLLTASTPPGDEERVAVIGDPRAGGWPGGVRTTTVGLLGGHGAVALVARPEWPGLTEVVSHRVDAGWWSVLRFAAPVDVAAVVEEVGRQSVWRDSDGAPRPRVGPGPGAIGPFDERVLNPVGFVPAVDGPVVDVTTLGAITPAVVASLRTAAAVSVAGWDGAEVHAAAALALAGVPVVADRAPDVLGAALRDAITAPVDLRDATAREEHSVLLRRAAFDRFSTLAQRSGGAPRQPHVSILLATRRADMLDFALAQVARQRGVDSLELVLAPHGFDVPVARVQSAVGPHVAVQVLPHSDSTLFGDVLHAAARAAGGDVLLKMDDDDWYAPDVVADLVRARAWSGAELVGMPAELHYLAEVDRTAKRGHPVELYTSFVAGGTMLVDRDALRDAGGFRPVRKWVDAQLIDALGAMGAATYRTHGLGYVLRRNASGHTWNADLEYLLDPVRTVATWPGFRPSRLLEPDPRWSP